MQWDFTRRKMHVAAKTQGGNFCPLLHTSREHGGESIFEARRGPRHESLGRTMCICFREVYGKKTGNRHRKQIVYRHPLKDEVLPIERINGSLPRRSSLSLYPQARCCQSRCTFGELGVEIAEQCSSDVNDEQSFLVSQKLVIGMRHARPIPD